MSWIVPLLIIICVMAGVITLQALKIKTLKHERYSLRVLNNYYQERVAILKEELARLG